MRAVEYECASLQTRRVSRLQSCSLRGKRPNLRTVCSRKPFGDDTGPPQDLESRRPRADSAASPMGSTAPLRAATAASRARVAAAERPAPAIELNDLENQHPAQPVEVPGDDDYTLS